MPKRIPLIVFSAALLLMAAARTASAHAFGQRYDLPLPLAFYLIGAGAVVGLSFIVMAVFLKGRSHRAAERQIDLLSFKWLRPLAHPWTLAVLRGLSVGVFIFLIVAGFIGADDALKNIAPTFIWVIWWVGLAFISALGGNLWALINPLDNLFGLAERLMRRTFRPMKPYPACLGRWPAVALFFAFIWMELIAEHGENPRILATLMIVYGVLTWVGMAVYGRRDWLDNAEAFSVAFGLLARFAPTVGQSGQRADGRENQWVLRFPGTGLLSQRPVSFSGVCFVLLLLTSVTFDGILEIPAWAAMLDWIAESQALRPLLLALQGAGFNLIVVIKTVALVVFPLVFLSVFMTFSAWIGAAGGAGHKIAEIAGYFILSLVPIAIAYHLSHYLSYLLIAGQLIIPLVSDPFGWGWDLFGTAAYALDVGVINAQFVWTVAVSAIIAGHVLAVYVAHVMALRVFDDYDDAIRSQGPMLLLMIGYTMLSLWILSQPIVN